MSHLSRIEAQRLFFQWVAEVEAEKKAARVPPEVPRRPVRVQPVIPRRPVRSLPVIPRRPVRGPPAFPGLPSEYKQPERKIRIPRIRTIEWDKVKSFNNISPYKLALQNYNINDIDNPFTRLRIRNLGQDVEVGPIPIVDYKEIDEKYIRHVFTLVSESNLNRMEHNQAVDFMRALSESKYNSIRITMLDGSITYRPINNITYEFIADFLKGEIQNVEVYGSDRLTIISDTSNYSKVEPYVLRGRINGVRSVAFFNAYNTTDIDLKKYQIFTEEQFKLLDKEIAACYIHSLRMANIEEPVLNAIKLQYISGCHLSKDSYKEIANIIKRNIVLSFYNDSQIHTTKYNYSDDDHKHDPVLLAIYNNHIFINEQTKYTAYSIKNYNEIKHIPEFNKIYNSRHDKANDRFISSLKLVKLMDECSLFKEAKIQLSPHQKININLDNIKNEQKEIKNSADELKTLKPYCSNIWFSDCESFVSTGIHSLYLIGTVSIDKDAPVKIFNVCQSSEQKTVWSWLNAVTKNGTENALCYFHNLKYDYNLLEKYLNICSICSKDGNIYNVKLKYKNKEIELRDSYKLLSVKLCQFSDMFNLGLSKLEAINYEYYTKENNNKVIDSKVYRDLLKPADQKIFDTVVTSKTFNPLKYYIDYLKNDCLVLKHGLIALNQILLDITDNNLGAFHKLTISSLTDTFMRLSGVFDGVYEMTGNLRAYCGQSAYGGRVHANEKYVGKIVNNKPIADFDSVSCYPSAIYRVNHELGLPTGPAQRISESDLKDWELFHWCVLTVKITKVNKIQQMPIIAHRGKESIEYLNEPPEEPVIIDKVTLEDYIKLHDIEYQVLDGIFWNGMPNKKWKNIIYNLFQERLKYKKTNKPLANTLKLMLNSAYGKCLIKASKQKTSIVKSVTSKKVDGKWVVNNPDNIGTYIKNNFNTIKSLRQMNDKQYEVQQIAIDTTYNRAHIASFILSMSKRIMNEIFYIANELQEPIFYQDTDSMHIYDESIEILQQEYKRVYGRELIGKQLGQFHPDFDNPPGFEGYMTSSAFLALGKKSYIDRLACNGIDTGHNHIRLKGITKLGIQHAIEQYEDAGISDGAWQLFNDLAEGKKKEILLNPILRDGTTGVMFDIAGGVIKTQKEFIRTLHFPNLNNE